MRGLTEASFGVVIAYLVPGLVALSAVSELLPTVESWLGVHDENASLGGFLYGTLAALASGLLHRQPPHLATVARTASEQARGPSHFADIKRNFVLKCMSSKW